MESQIVVLLYILLGAVAAMIYSLRRIVSMEKKILRIETAILNLEKKLIKK